MKKMIILTGVMLLGNAAHGYSYGSTINRNYNGISHNKAYAQMERKHAQELYKAKDKLQDAIGDYYKAHQDMEKWQARVNELEANRPSHREYRSDWSYGSTGISYGRGR